MKNTFGTSCSFQAHRWVLVEILALLIAGLISVAMVTRQRHVRVAAEDLRPDVDPMDMLRAIYGVSSAGSTGDWPAKARRFVDILIQGSRPAD